MVNRQRGVLLILTIGIVMGCSSRIGDQLSRPAAPDYWPTRGWESAAPASRGMDAERLDRMIDSLRKNRTPVDSIQIIREGYLVLDYYGPDSAREDLHIIHSCTKSIVSLLIGIALDQGLIAGLDQPVMDFFPGREAEGAAGLTLRHLLTMSTGLASRDSYLYRWVGITAMTAQEDWVDYILRLPAEVPPGERFDYSNMASHLLSAILTEATGQSALEYAQEHLFGPLGIRDIIWPACPRGVSIGWGEIRLKPLDLAKIGLLVLQEGTWEDRQIVSAAYVKDATSPHMEAGTLHKYYGYQWWVTGEGPFMALGYAGQYLIVHPGEDLIVIFTSSLPDRNFFLPRDYYREYILKSLTS